MNPSVFFKLLASADKAASLQTAISELTRGSNTPSNVHIVAPESFDLVPGSPLAYWVSDTVRSLFSALPKFGTDGRAVKQGLATADDFRFVRAWWEVTVDEIFDPPIDCTVHNAPQLCLQASQAGTRWFPFAKGGEYFSFYADIHLALNWAENGKELKAWADPLYGNSGWSRILKSVDFYFRAGYTYPLRTSRFCPQVMPAGTIISVRGSGIYGDTTGLYLALLSSKPFDYLVKMMLGWASRPQFDMGDINMTPVPQVSISDSKRLSELALSCATLKRAALALFEETHVFICPAIVVPGKGFGLQDAANACQAQAIRLEEELLSFWREIDDIAFRLYDFSEADQKAIKNETVLLFANSDHGPDSPQNSKVAPVENDRLQSVALIADLISYALGSTFGRWDIRYSTGELSAPEPSDLFAPLPACPPAQLQNEHGIPASSADIGTEYPIRIPWDGILVDDPSHPLDVEIRTREIFELIWNGQGDKDAQAVEIEACKILGINSLRDWFRRSSNFFALHLKRYSKSRRQAPIYWQLSAGSGSYSAWLYYHRFTQDTLYRLLRDFVEPRIQQAEREQFDLESQGALSGEAASRLQETQTLLQDLRIFKSELDLVAPLWNPNLNDGVIINHAILWRITPYTPWQKKCKECWDKLVKGDYDWAHLAFHLWPERVIPKCTTDRSLAIAHGLEEQLWQETNNGNWLPRQLSEADLQALIAEHSNPAVKSALERFLAAPPPVAPTRTRASRSTRSSGSSTPRPARGSAAVVDAEATRQVLLALSAAPSDGLAKAAIADLIGVEANAITAVIKQLKESGQIDQLGERRGARYVLSEQGRAAVASQAGEDD